MNKRPLLDNGEAFLNDGLWVFKRFRWSYLARVIFNVAKRDSLPP